MPVIIDYWPLCFFRFLTPEKFMIDCWTLCLFQVFRYWNAGPKKLIFSPTISFLFRFTWACTGVLLSSTSRLVFSLSLISFYFGILFGLHHAVQNFIYTPIPPPQPKIFFVLMLIFHISNCYLQIIFLILVNAILIDLGFRMKPSCQPSGFRKIELVTWLLDAIWDFAIQKCLDF